MDLPQRSECVHGDPLGQMIRVRADASAWMPFREGRRAGRLEVMLPVPGIVAGG
jgi:hypothetical protein